MYRLFLPFLSLLFASIATTNASTNCLTDVFANRVAQNFRSLIRTYSNADAAAFLTVNFTDYSDSVNELINSGCPNGSQPLGLPTFTSLQNFQNGQGSQPNIPFNVLNVWHSCAAVTLRWRSLKPAGTNSTQDGQQEVTGIAVLETVFNQGYYGTNHSQEPYFIKRVFSEFNSGAWLVDTGTLAPSCMADGTPTVTTNGSAAVESATGPANAAKMRRVRYRV